jgi:hypothetical protein
MRNKLPSIIIDNPSHMSFGYMLRDFSIAFATLAIWIICLAKLYLFLRNGQAFVADMYPIAMARIILLGFFITFISFHLWSLYNKSLYKSEMKRTTHAPTISDGNEEVIAGSHGSVELSPSSITEHVDATHSAHLEFGNG